ncbi:hypothetical protein HNQ91_004305 [Filimonas zeae]|uniref:Uncharacterized protein n=1 Tax=Filimonas zeae TaxID=1737353 RepID=A0A917MZQ9_9BACT|nr:hypothetical protein [Filimonas zeae]MDR6341232.1 hypothetical protein [Filimonas zeae]GGH76699.1 hypothetical protein GCM10011379_41930 [Filimonas zeae]
MKTRILFLLIFCLHISFVNGQIDDNWKEITLCDSSVRIKVPEAWKAKSPYRQYPSYEIKHNMEVGLPQSNTSLKVDVFDSASRITVFIDNETLEYHRTAQTKTIGKLDSLKKEVVVRNGIDVAMLKYVYYDKKRIPRYGMIVLFRRDSSSYYELKLSCGSLSVHEGKELAEIIIGSLRLN